MSKEKQPFASVVSVMKVSTCATCNSYIYTMPCPIEIDFGDFFQGVASLVYPLNKLKIVYIEDSNIRLKSRVGRNWFEVKFKANPDEIKKLFDLHLSSYIESKVDVNIEV